MDAYQRRRGRPAKTFFELAAGPGRHSLAAAAAGLTVTALDLSPEMAAYTKEKAARAGARLQYLVADMAHFEPPGTFDLAACLSCSASYLLSDTAVLSHLSSVRAALTPDGMYLLELTHPAELGGATKSKNTWRMSDARGEVQIDWGGQPVAGVWESHVTLVYQPSDGAPPVRVEDDACQRGFTLEEATRFADRSGFALEATLGGFDEDLPLDDPRASRMLLLLRKT